MDKDHETMQKKFSFKKVLYLLGIVISFLSIYGALFTTANAPSTSMIGGAIFWGIVLIWCIAGVIRKN